MPKVSVILPSYNHAPYLEKRIESILNQTFTDFELIILDDHSLDNSWEIINKYKSNTKITHTILNSVQSGKPILQWIKGFGLVDSNSKYIWLAESDDFSELTFLGKMVEILENNSNIGLAFCASNWVDNKNHIIEVPNHENKNYIIEGNTLIRSEFTKGCLIYNASSAVFSKSLLPQVNFQLLEPFSYAADWFFWVQLLKNSTISHINERLNYFRRHEKNTSFKSDRQGLQYSEGFKIVAYIIQKHNIIWFEKVKIYIYWAQKAYLDQSIQPTESLKLLPQKVKIWYRFIPIIRALKLLFKL